MKPKLYLASAYTAEDIEILNSTEEFGKLGGKDLEWATDNFLEIMYTRISTTINNDIAQRLADKLGLGYLEVRMALIAIESDAFRRMRAFPPLEPEEPEEPEIVQEEEPEGCRWAKCST